MPPKSRLDLLNELVKLEDRIMAVKKMKKEANADYREQIGDLEEQKKRVMEDIIRIIKLFMLNHIMAGIS